MSSVLSAELGLCSEVSVVVLMLLWVLRCGCSLCFVAVFVSSFVSFSLSDVESCSTVCCCCESSWWIGVDECCDCSVMWSCCVGVVLWFRLLWVCLLYRDDVCIVCIAVRVIGFWVFSSHALLVALILLTTLSIYFLDLGDLFMKSLCEDDVTILAGLAAD